MNARGRRKRRIGVVISNKMKDTVVVDISRRIPILFMVKSLRNIKSLWWMIPVILLI